MRKINSRVAIERGVRQYVVLGAGLDTFAYRNPFQSFGLHVFEVDHPATQEWKREQLRAAGIAVPEEMTFAAVDFERQSLADGLLQAGFDKQRPAFFSWLGVTPYLSRAAFDATMQFIAGLPSGSGVVFDYAVKRSLLSPRTATGARRSSRSSGSRRGTFSTVLRSRRARQRSGALGLRIVEDLGCDESMPAISPDVPMVWRSQAAGTY